MSKKHMAEEEVKKRRMEGGDAAGHRLVKEILLAADVGDDVSLNAPLRALCSVSRVPLTEVDDATILRLLDKPISYVLMTKEHREAADRLFGPFNMYFVLLQCVQEAIIALGLVGIDTLADWCQKPTPVDVPAVVTKVLDKAAGSVNMSRSRLYASKEHNPIPRDYTHQMNAMLSANSESYRVTWEGTEKDRFAGDEKNPKAYELVERVGGEGGQPFDMQSKWGESEALRVLTIDKTHLGMRWPADAQKLHRARQLFVRRESDVVLHSIFEHVEEEGKTPPFLRWKTDRTAFVITGTPGIGKTFLSCYLLWWLLRREVRAPIGRDYEDGWVTITAILHAVYDDVIVYDKTETPHTAHWYPYSEYEKAYAHFLSLLPRDDMGLELLGAGLELFDCCHGRSVPSNPCPVLVFTSPDINHTKDLENNTRHQKLIVNPWSVDELCAWSHCIHKGTPDLAAVKHWMYFVGPIPRLLVDKSSVLKRKSLIDAGLKSIKTISDLFRYAGKEGGIPNGHPSHLFMMMLRVEECAISTIDIESTTLPWKNEPVSKYVENHIDNIIKSLSELEQLSWCQDIMDNPSVFGAFFEKVALTLCVSHLPIIFSKSASVEQRGGSATIPTNGLVPPIRRIEAVPEGPLDVNVLYTPPAKKIPVIDAFIYLSSTPRTFVGIQITISKRHPPKVGALQEFNTIFKKWRIPKDAKKIILYLNPSDHARLGNAFSIEGFDGRVEDHVSMKTFWDIFFQRQYTVENTIKAEVDKAIKARCGIFQ